MDHGNISVLLNELNSSSIIDTLTLHSICHCMDFEGDNLIKIINQHLGKHIMIHTLIDYLIDKAVQFSTL